MFITGPLLYAVFSVMGMLFSNHTPIVYIAVVFALQTNAMAIAVTIISHLKFESNKANGKSKTIRR